MFINEFLEIVKFKKIDIVIISGDIFDTFNPPSRAESLYYETIKKLTDLKVLTVIIAGNHDNPIRLEAISPLVRENGVIISGNVFSEILPGKYDFYEIISYEKGLVEINLKGERVKIALLPYPSESRLNEAFKINFTEEDFQKEYSYKVKKIMDFFDSKFEDDTINIVVSHLFVMGSKSSESERPIQIGGGYLIEKDKLAKKADYIALGHLHRPQKVLDKPLARYSGSPVQYSKSEILYSKCVYIVEIDKDKNIKLEEHYLKNYKPIEIWQVNSINEALEKAKENANREVYVYFEIVTDEIIPLSIIKELKSIKSSILSIKPIIDIKKDELKIYEVENKNIEKLFEEFYEKENLLKPTKEILDMFLSIALGEEEDETIIS